MSPREAAPRRDLDYMADVLAAPSAELVAYLRENREMALERTQPA